MFLRFTSIFFCFSFVFSQFDWNDNGVPIRQGIHIEWQRTGDNGNENEMIFDKIKVYFAEKCFKNNIIIKNKFSYHEIKNCN